MSPMTAGSLFIGGCLLLFLLSGAETAVIAANRRRFREAEAAGDQTAAGVMDLLGDLRRILVATLAGRTLAVVAAAVGLRNLLLRCGVDWLNRPLAGGVIAAADVAAVVLASIVFVLLGDAVARAVFRPQADKVVRALPLPMQTLARVVGPLTGGLQGIVRLILAPFGGAAHGRAYRRGELAQLFNVGSAEAIQAIEFKEEDLLDTAGRSMIQNIADLDRTRAREIMRPLVDVVAVRLGEMNLEGLKDLAARTGYSKFPVYRTRVLRLEGYISIYDVLRNDDPSRTRPEDFVQPAYYAPEQMRVNALLQVFLQNRLAVAFVVDEYGACSGFVTREDLFEEIVGDVEDEFDPERPTGLRMLEDGAVECDGQIDIDDLNEALGADFPKEGFETLAGWIYDTLNRVPAPGETLLFGPFVVEVVEMDRATIKRARIRKADEEE